MTARQRQVIHLYASGRRRCEIADTLGISAKSIDAHLDHIKERLGARTSVHAVALYVYGLERMAAKG